MSKKNSQDAKRDKVSLIELIDAWPTSRAFDRVILHAILNETSYGTISGRLIDLLGANLIEEAGTNNYQVSTLREGMNLPANWNPVAASNGPFLVGETNPKSYRKTEAWSFALASKAVDLLGAACRCDIKDLLSNGHTRGCPERKKS